MTQPDFIFDAYGEIRKSKEELANYMKKKKKRCKHSMIREFCSLCRKCGEEISADEDSLCGRCI